jgi:hypothetical protein
MTHKNLNKLEIIKLKNEIKWNSGFRRVLDRFLTPTTITVVIVSISFYITYADFKRKQNEEIITNLEKNLIIPSLAPNSAVRLINLGANGDRTLASFLYNSDSTTIRSQISIILNLAENFQLKKDSLIYSDLFCPLLIKSIYKLHYSNTSNLLLTYYLYTSINNFNNKFYLKSIYEYLTQFEIEYKELFNKELVDFYLRNNYRDKQSILVPGGNFLVDGKISYIDNFIVRFKFVSHTDSIKILSILHDSNLKDISKIRDEIFNLNIFKSITAAYTGSDTDPKNKCIEFDITPKYIFRYYTKTSQPSGYELFLMERKLVLGPLGLNNGYLNYPYSPLALQRMKFIRYSDGTERLFLPSLN